MKKLLLSLAAAIITLGFTSCSEDEMPVSTGSDGNVTFSVSLDNQAGSRAFGDGFSATTLKYAVYSANYDELVTEGSTSFASNALSANVSLELVSGQEYKIVFFAYKNMNGVYTFNSSEKSIEVDYAKMNNTSSQKNDYDCFYKVEKVVVGNSPINRSVVLTRPVAQLNFGTSDLKSAAVQNTYGDSYGNLYIRTKYTGKAYSKMNILTGQLSEEVEFTSNTAATPVGADYGTFPVEGHDYLFCIYLLASEQSQLVDCSLIFHRSSTPVTTFSINNVPIQRNYRTNIYGKLLTSTTEFEVTKDPNINGSVNHEIWDGTPGTLPQPVDGVYNIVTASQLAAVAKAVNSGTSMSGMTVRLSNDIDLQNFQWTPIGNTDNPFRGNFDGNGYTIANLYIDNSGKPACPAGLFGKALGNSLKDVNIDGVNINVRDAVGKSEATGSLVGTCIVSEISGVNVNNVNITSYRQSGGIAGAMYGSLNNCTAENVDINLALQPLGDGTYDNGDKAGALVGLTQSDNGESNTFNNNSATNITITGYRDLGGLFGMMTRTFANNTITNANIYITLENADKYVFEGGKQAKPENFGEFYGRGTNTTINGGGNVATNVTIHEPQTGIDSQSKLETALASGGYIQLAENATVTLTKELTVTTPSIISIPASATVNIGSNRITNDSELTIEGEGTFTGTSFLVVNNNDCDLTINSGTFVSTTHASYPYGSVISSEGNLTINGGSFKSTGAGSALTLNYMKNGQPYTGKTVINGGEFSNEKSGNYAVSVNGKGDLTINDGKFVGYFGCFRTNSAKGEIIINGGTFLCNGTGNTYYAIAVDPETTDSGSTVTVNGGKFWSTNSTVYCRSTSTLNLKGGVFKALNGYSPAAGFIASTISETETVTVNGIVIEPTYTVKISE